MKATKIISSIILFATIISFLSCRKWLDKKPDTNLSTPETLVDLQAMIDNGIYINFEITPSLPEASADDYFLLQSIIDRGGNDAMIYTWQPFTFTPGNDWRSCYIPIYNVNVILEKIQDIPKTAANSQQWDNVKGSALYLRSYFFLQLLWAYSKAYDVGSAHNDMGIALRLGSDFNVPSVRATVQQSYEQVINDTKEAASYLPDIAIHSLRPSKAAAYGLLARAYLSMRDYANALKYSDFCLKIYNQLMDYNGDSDIVGGGGAQQPFKRFNKETIFYTEMSLDHPIANPTYGKLDTVLYSLYSNDDLRKTAFFRPDGPYRVFRGSYTQHSVILFTGIATDEMYLTKAECIARVGNGGTGDKDLAIAVLDTLLRKRWITGNYTSPAVSTPQQALNIILSERRKELIFRGLRWMDIKRLNKEGYAITPKRITTGQTYTLSPNDNRYALPIPQDIIQITGMPQNPQ
jgi:starch-binding outer membrane protein, SusD/RagB family